MEANHLDTRGIIHTIHFITNNKHRSCPSCPCTYMLLNYILGLNDQIIYLYWFE